MWRCRTSRAVSRRGRMRAPGCYVLPCFQRHRSASERMAFLDRGPKTVLHGVRDTIHSELIPMRPGTKPAVADCVQNSSGRGRRRTATQRTSNPRRHFSAAKRGMAFAVYGVAVVMAPAIGPTLGGWITDNYSWRWIFSSTFPSVSSPWFSRPPHPRPSRLKTRGN